MEPSFDMVDGVYASQISCLATGYDQWRWTGLMLVENWFEEEADDPTRDMVGYYENAKEDGMSWDPFSRGRDDIERSPLFPRRHFLRAMEVRLNQCKAEWENLCYNLNRRLTGVVRSLSHLSLTFVFFSSAHTDLRCNRPGSKRHSWRRYGQLQRRVPCLPTYINSSMTLRWGSSK